MHLYRVSSYLEKLESDPDGWDFEERYKYAQKIKQEIRTALIEDLPLDLTAGREGSSSSWTSGWRLTGSPQATPSARS